MKHLLQLRGVSKKKIDKILDEAKQFKESPTEVFSYLKGKSIALVFSENSTRTKISFELAIRKLGGMAIIVSLESSSMKKGESLLDTLINIESMKVSGFVFRDASSGAAEVFSRSVSVPVINAGDGCHEHPTQALSDIFTLKEQLGNLEGKKILIVGDILHSRVARSNIWGLLVMKAKVLVLAPVSLIPVGIQDIGVCVVHDLKTALQEVDAVISLRLQFERMRENFIPSVREYRHFFGITQEVLNNQASKKIVFMHPGPINRHIEVENSVADKTSLDENDGRIHSTVLQQTKNSVAVRMACLKLSLLE